MKIIRVLTIPILAVALLVAGAMSALAWHPLSLSGSTACQTGTYQQVGTVMASNPETQDAKVLSEMGAVFHVGQEIPPGTHSYTVTESGDFHQRLDVEVTVNYPGDSTPRASNTIILTFEGECLPPTTTSTTEKPPPTTEGHGSTTTTEQLTTTTPSTEGTALIPPIAVVAPPDFTG